MRLESQEDRKRIAQVRWTAASLTVALALAVCGKSRPHLTPVPNGLTARKDPASSRAGKAQTSITKEVTDFVESRVAAGFDPPERIVQCAVDMYSDDQPEEALRPVAQRVTDDAVHRFQRAQASWPAVTDCDRLDHAFQELESIGIVSRQNFSDCGTCGAAEIVDEIQATKKRGKPVRGYTFYHEQDTESAVSGSGLYLNYGAVEDGERAALEIAREIVAALNRQGLKTKWDGTWEQRIRVNLDWKRRRSL
jgi:hypothetical protein